jgi:signal transduction histidine kinase
MRIAAAAEERLNAHALPHTGSHRAYADQMRLLHELQVHQIELEMQNQLLIEAQSEISRNLAQLTELYDLAPIAYFTLDRNGCITKSNAMARKLLGSPFLMLDRCHLSHFVARDALHAYQAFIDRVFSAWATGVLQPDHVRLVDTPPIHVFMEGVADENRQECRLVVTDLSRQHASEEALAALAIQAEELAAAKTAAAETANRAKARFLANMSHEIRTPMSAILGMTHLMQRSGLNANQEAQLEKINGAATHLLGSSTTSSICRKLMPDNSRLSRHHSCSTHCWQKSAAWLSTEIKAKISISGWRWHLAARTPS